MSNVDAVRPGPLGPDFDVLGSRRVYRMLRPWEVRERTRFSSSHINRLQGARCFPLYGRLAPRAVGLPEHVLDAFLAERIAARASMPVLSRRKPLALWHFSVDKVPAHCGIRLLRRDEVVALTGLPKSTFYPLIPRGLFPGQIPLGECAVRWVAHEVQAWVLSSPLSLSGSFSAESADGPSPLSL